MHCVKRCRAAPIVLCSASKFATFGCPVKFDGQKWCRVDMNILRPKAAHLHSLVCKCASKLQRVKWRVSSFPSLWFRSTYLPIDQKTTLHSICKDFAASNDLIDLVESTAPDLFGRKYCTSTYCGSPAPATRRQVQLVQG